jgi:hypothetical protein
MGTGGLWANIRSCRAAPGTSLCKAASALPELGPFSLNGVPADQSGEIGKMETGRQPLVETGLSAAIRLCYGGSPESRVPHGR